MPDRRSRVRFAGVIFCLVGWALIAEGLSLVWRTAETGNLVRAGNGVRDAALTLPHAALIADAQRLTAASSGHWTSGDAGAATFLYYAAAEESRRDGNVAQAKEERASAIDMARQTLRVAPTRADVALALAEMTYLNGGDFAAVRAPLMLSYETAPRELWIIRRRIGLGLRLAAKADPELKDYITADIRTLGEPFHDPVYYAELARAAFLAGPAAVQLVRAQLATSSDTTLHLVDEDLDKLAASKPSGPALPAR